MQPLFERCSDLPENHRCAECIGRPGELVRSAADGGRVGAARGADAALFRGLELRPVTGAAVLVFLWVFVVLAILFVQTVLP